jgi:MerR family copper efflux transcriptional regulator
MDTLGIAELAERTGFSRPTLRYYEEIGLLDAPQRTETGYRVYDRGVEARLQFIRRAKRLGLSLEEIRSLVAVWAGGECAVTRRQLRQLVEVKIAAVREQVEDSATFLRQLEGVHDRLDELLTTGQSATGCECAPELPHVSAGAAAAGGAGLRVRDPRPVGGPCRTADRAPARPLR